MHDRMKQGPTWKKEPENSLKVRWVKRLLRKGLSFNVVGFFVISCDGISHLLSEVGYTWS